MEKECRFSYNNTDDSLIVSCREENENIRENFMFDNFIFSLTGKGKIVGLQIRNVSKVLAETNVNPAILEDIKAINMAIAKKDNCLFIGLAINSGNQISKIPLRVLMPPLANLN